MQHITLPSLPFSLLLYFSPSNLLHIAKKQRKKKAALPLAAVSMAAHTDTIRRSPCSAVNHNQLVEQLAQIYHHQLRTRALMCEPALCR